MFLVLQVSWIQTEKKGGGGGKSFSHAEGGGAGGVNAGQVLLVGVGCKKL